MPPKKADQLKRAAADLDDVLNDSPVRRKKSKPNLVQTQVAVPGKVPPPPEVITANPLFVDTFEPEAALRLTRATNSINYAIDKINLYVDLLNLFDNEQDDRAVALASRTNDKIAKWGAYRDKVKQSMDVLLKIAPKKKAGVLLDTQVAEGFLSSSGESIPSNPPIEASVPSFGLSFKFFTLFGAHAYAFLYRILLDSYLYDIGLIRHFSDDSSWTAAPSPLICVVTLVTGWTYRHRRHRLDLPSPSSPPTPPSDEDESDGNVEEDGRLEQIEAVLSDSEDEGANRIMVKTEVEGLSPSKLSVKRRASAKK